MYQCFQRRRMLPIALLSHLEIIDETCISLDCERSTVYILDEKRNELWSKVAKGQKRTIKVANGVGIAGTVSQTKEKLNIANAYSDNRFNKDID